jgi:hypothetical protein
MLIDLSEHDLQMVIQAVQYVASGDDLLDNGSSEEQAVP